MTAGPGGLSDTFECLISAHFTFSPSANISTHTHTQNVKLIHDWFALGSMHLFGICDAIPTNRVRLHPKCLWACSITPSHTALIALGCRWLTDIFRCLCVLYVHTDDGFVSVISTAYFASCWRIWIGEKPQLLLRLSGGATQCLPACLYGKLFALNN